jgi:spore germination cell wall hydrolase CwlJ-like protein
VPNDPWLSDPANAGGIPPWWTVGSPGAAASTPSGAPSPGVTPSTVGTTLNSLPPASTVSQATNAAPTSGLMPSMMGMPGMPMDEGQRDTLIRTIHGEASADPTERAAIAHVVMNRMAAGGFGDTPASVATQSAGAPGYHQFSTWNDPSKQGDQSANFTTKDPDYAKIGAIVDGVQSGAIPDPSHGATFYYGPQSMPGHRVPPWAPGLVKQGFTPTSIGAQIFYKPPTVMGALGG